MAHGGLQASVLSVFVLGWLGTVLQAEAKNFKAPFIHRQAQEEIKAPDWYWANFQKRPSLHLSPSRCPRLFPKYAIVAPGGYHNVRWMTGLHEDIEGIAYQDKEPHKPHYFHPGGNEAGAYLQFIVDYYDCLPEAVAFVHGHETEGWHNLPMIETMTSLNWSAIPGYTDLNRKMPIWSIQLRNRRRTPDADPIATGTEVFNGNFKPFQIIDGNAYEHDDALFFTQDEATSRSYDKFFGPMGLGAKPDKINFVCCSQLAATRERIRARDRAFWYSNLQYMLHNDVYDANTKESRLRVVGDMWTVYWPMILGEPPDYDRRLEDNVLFSGVKAGSG